MHRHIEYIHHNSVKHGYAAHPEEWAYSSYHRRVNMKNLYDAFYVGWR